MARIGLVVPDIAHAGGVRAVSEFLLNVITRLSEHEARVISLTTSSSDHLNTSLRRPFSLLGSVGITESSWRGVPLTRVGAPAGELEFMRYAPRRALSKLVEQLDLVQVICGSPAWARPVEKLGIPVSVHVATLAKVERATQIRIEGGLLGMWRRAMTFTTSLVDRSALLHADAIQAMNPWLLRHCENINSSRNDVAISYAPPGVDSTVFRPSNRPRNSCAPYLLCVGRLDDPRKNTTLLLDAFSIIAKANSEVELVTAGILSPPEGYFERARALGLDHRVRHVQAPTLQELVTLYQESSVFVSSSNEEGFGVAIVEAMACGRPVVSTRSGGPQGIISDGIDGYLVDIKDEIALAQRALLLLEDTEKANSMGSKARQTVERRFSFESAGKHFLEIWGRLLSRPPHKDGCRSR